MKKRWKIRLQPKLLLGLITMAAILGLTLAPAVSQLYRTRMEEYYSQLAFGQASIAAQLIDGDRIETYYRQGTKDDYYHKIHRYLQSARVNMGLQYFYVVVPEDEVMYYIWDAGVPGEDGVCDLGDTDAYYGGGNELMHGAFAADAPQTILITNNEEYGYLASAYVAILNSSGQPVALASVDISMDMINQQIRTFLAVTVCITLIVLLVSILVYHFYVRKIVIRPLDTLHHAAMGLVKDQMAHLEDFQVEVHTGDEVEELADSFRFMVQELNDYIQNLSRVTAEKERISTELEQIMEDRAIYRAQGSERSVYVTDTLDRCCAAIAAPIISEGDALGLVLFVENEGENHVGETEYKLAQTIASFLGRHMES